MTHWANTLLQNYNRNNDGNFSIMFGMLSLLFAIAVSVVFDFSVLSSKKLSVQDRMDAAALAAAKLIYVNRKSKREGQALVNDMLDDLITGESLRCEPIEAADNEVKINCQGSVKTIMPGVVNRGKMDYQILSSAMAGDGKKYEIAFVFDISSSMDNSVLALQDALDDFVNNQLFSATPTTDAIFSLIPYGGSVAFDSSFSRWLDPVTGLSLTPSYTGCFMPEATDLSQPFTGDATQRAARNHQNRRTRNYVCPDPSMAARFFVEETTSSVTTMVNNIKLSQATGSDVGLVWGYRSLLPEMRGILDPASPFPRDFDENHKKILILMTDGAPTNVRWRDANGRRLPVSGPDGFGRFKNTCDAIRAENKDIDIYMIGFGRANSGSRTDFRSFMEDCTMGDGQFVSARSENLSDILASILTREMDLRISY